MSDNLPAAGLAGAVPPPNAPIETTQPLGRDAGGILRDGGVVSPAQLARQNEKALAPLTYGSGVAESVDAARAGKLDPFYERRAQTAAMPSAGSEPTVAAGKTIKRITRASRQQPPTRPIVPPADPVMVPEQVDAGALPADPVNANDLAAGAVDQLPPGDLLPSATASVDYVPPAFSDTDSPARGIPRQLIPEGKEITGGFGDSASMQYFALNGQELRVLVEDLMQKLYDRIQDDLRFNEALVYPQVTAKVAISIEGFVHDADFTVDVALAKDHPAVANTPLRLAEQLGDQVCFVLIADRKETAGDGESAETPDQMRVSLGLKRPMKRVIQKAGGAVFIDVD